MIVVRLSALRTGRLYPRKCFWYSFLLETESITVPECDRNDGGKVVSLTHRPPLPQEMLLVLISVRG